MQLNQLAAFPAPIRLLVFLLLLGLIWLPLAAPIAVWSRDPNQTTIWVMLLLFVEFLILVRWWGHQVHRDPQIFQTYGLSLNTPSFYELLQGLVWGVLSVGVMFLLQSGVGWQHWQSPSSTLLKIAAEGLLVAVGVGLAEELVFRGWILDELQRDYKLQVGLWMSSLLFATLHFLKPLPEIIRTFPQFPGLVLLGLILVWMKRSTSQLPDTAVKSLPFSGRLALPIGFHAGLVWGYYLLKVGNLVKSTDRAADWVTGIDGNPLSGLVGLLFLSGLAIYWHHRARRFKF